MTITIPPTVVCFVLGVICGVIGVLIGLIVVYKAQKQYTERQGLERRKKAPPSVPPSPSNKN